MWTIISCSVEQEMEDFAGALFTKQIIGKRARNAKDCNAMLDGFIKCMDLFTTVEEFQDHCSILVDILDDIGGPAGRTGARLKESWKVAVKDKLGMDFDIK